MIPNPPRKLKKLFYLGNNLHYVCPNEGIKPAFDSFSFHLGGFKLGGNFKIKTWGKFPKYCYSKMLRVSAINLLLIQGKLLALISAINAG